MNAPSERRTCPYVGLQPFEEADRELFFGRERDQRIIIANLLASPLTILYGSSGVGKSSVLMAGVVPQLRRDRPRTPVIVFRDWFKDDLSSALTRTCIDGVWHEGVDQPRPADNLPFDEVLRACAEAAHETLLLILDQFEEYFLYQPKSADPASFEAGLARAVNREDVDVGLLISLRDDGLAKLDRFKERIPDLMSNRLELKHLEPAGAAEAIRRPLAVWNAKYAPPGKDVVIEEALVTELIRQVGIGQLSAGGRGGSGVTQAEKGYVEAPFLQLVMVRPTGDRLLTVANDAAHLWSVDDPSGPRRRFVHGGPIYSAFAVSDDARLLATAGDGAARARVIKVWDLDTPDPEPEPFSTIDVAGAWVMGLAFSPDGCCVATACVNLGGPDRTAASIWDIATGVELMRVPLREASDAVAFTPDGRSLVTASRDARVRVWRPADGALDRLLGRMRGQPSPQPADVRWFERILAGHAERVRDVAVSRDGSRVATGGGDHLVKLWDIETGENLLTLQGHRGYVEAVAFSPGSDRWATAGHDGRIRLWGLSGEVLGGIEAPAAQGQERPFLSRLAFSPDGSTLLALARKWVYRWPIGAFQHARSDPIAVLTIEDTGYCGALAQTRDGRRIAVGCNDARVRLFDAASGRLAKTITVHQGAVTDLAFSPDGSQLATASVDRTFHVSPLAFEVLYEAALRPRSATAGEEP
jgi:WD40 repeat protein